MKYYIGVDGGGTKTAFALFDENKKMLTSVTGAGSNHENIETAFEGASDIIIKGLNDLCEKAGIALGDVSFTLMGLAGIDHQYQYEIMCDLLRKKGLANFEVFNDGFIVVKAGASGKSATVLTLTATDFSLRVSVIFRVISRAAEISLSKPSVLFIMNFSSALKRHLSPIW